MGLAFNGTDFLVSWRSNLSLYLTRVSSQGIVKDSNGISIPSYNQLACQANGCLLAWNGAGISVSRVGADGSLLDSPPIQAFPSSDPDVPLLFAPSGTGYILQSANNGATVRLDATGHPVGAPMAGNARQMYACGSNFLIFNQLSVVDTFSASLVDSSGAVLVSNVPLGAPVKYNWGIASRADGCAVAWQKAGPTSGDIYGNFVANDGSTTSAQPMPLATDQFNEREPAIAFDGDRLLVAYSHLVPEEPYGNYCIAARIATNADGGAGTGGVGGGGAPSGSGGAPSGGGGAPSGGTGVGGGSAGTGASGSGGTAGDGGISTGGISTAGDGGVSTGGISIAGNGGVGTAGTGGNAGSVGVAGTLGTAGSVAGGPASLGGNPGDTSLGGSAGIGAGALGGAAGSADGNAAGAIDSNGGASGQDNQGGASGEEGSSTAGMGTTGGHAGRGSGMTGGNAGIAGNAPEPESCSCRIVGHEPAGNHLPAFAGVLLALGAALVRRRSAQGAHNPAG